MSATQNNNATGTATAAAAPQEAPSIKGPGLPPIVQRLEKGQKTPVCVIVVGMAGSGKSSLMAQMQHHLNSGSRRKTTTTSSSAEDSKPAAKEESSPKEEEKDTAVATATNTSESEDDAEGPDTAYCINLDPATHHLSFDASIDIRDTINYKEVMKQHNLGPNGGIMTSMLLYSTKFDQVMGILEKRAYGSDDAQAAAAAANKQGGGGGGGGDNATSSPPPSTVNNDGMDYILVDTPGQIEAFTWSASGSIISESLASAFPTVLCFVIDTARCASSPNTFMSNMLYACSMFYRTRLPVVIAFNKNDVVPHDFAVEWMKDYEAFQEALDESMESNTNNASTISSTGFYGSLTRSLSLVLDEFYSNFTHCCGVSAVTGDGMDDFWDAIDKAAREDFAMDYVDDLKNRMEEQQAKQRAMARASVRRMERDLQQDPQNR